MGDFYCGSITPNEQDMAPHSELKRAVDRVARFENQLTEQLDEAGQTVLAKLIESQHEIDSITARKNFIPGFRLGAIIIMECMDSSKADPTWHDFFYTELTTGLRLGEICGLMWTDFDNKAGTLRICRTLHQEKGGRLVAGGTKTYAGTRKIVLPPSTVGLLRAGKKTAFSPWIFHDPLRPEAPVNPSSTTLNVYAHVTDEMRRTAAQSQHYTFL